MSDVSPQSIWNRPVRGARGPEGELTRDQIAAVAIRLADAADLRAVTMRAVAASLGVSAGGLYRYLRSRDELVALMVDAALLEVGFPTGRGDWQEQLLAVAHEQLRVYRTHPWLVPAAFGSGAFGPNALRYFDVCLGILAEVSAGSTAKMEALAMLTGVVTLFARPAPDNAADPTTIFSSMNPVAHPHLAAAMAAPEQASPGSDLFDRTVLSLLRGLLPAAASGGK